MSCPPFSSHFILTPFAIHVSVCFHFLTHPRPSSPSLSVLFSIFLVFLSTPPSSLPLHLLLSSPSTLVPASSCRWFKVSSSPAPSSLFISVRSFLSRLFVFPCRPSPSLLFTPLSCVIPGRRAHPRLYFSFIIYRLTCFCLHSLSSFSAFLNSLFLSILSLLSSLRLLSSPLAPLLSLLFSLLCVSRVGSVIHPRHLTAPPML